MPSTPVTDSAGRQVRWRTTSSVAIDDPLSVESGSGDAVLRFGRDRGINYPLWLSDYETAVGRFGAAGYPFTLLIDGEGIIRRQYLGPQTARTLLRDIGALLVREPEATGAG